MYRTVYGPYFHHDGVVYGNTNNNINLALRRLTATREPNCLGMHDGLFTKQATFVIANMRLARMFRNLFREHLRVHSQLEEELPSFVNLPHPKSSLRRRALSKLRDKAILYESVWKDTVIGKIKRDEIAKPGKYPRLINDLSCEVSLMGAILSKHIKQNMANNPLIINGGEICFIESPDADVLAQVFDKLISPPGRFYFAYFSDDAVYSIRRADGTVYTVNLDISSCDSSHGEYIFKFLSNMVDGYSGEVMRNLIKQLTLPLVINSIDGQRQVLKHDKPILYSGSVLTTLVNNIANMLIGVSLSQTLADSPSDIITAAASVGYIVTCDECLDYGDIQFLKHSPVMVNGSIRPLLNIGVLLRSFGQCKGDLPGRAKVFLPERARLFDASLVSAFAARGEHSFISVARAKFGSNPNSRLDVNHYAPTFQDLVIPDEEILRRYRLHRGHWVELLEMYSGADFGCGIRCHASEVILYKDYGLSAVGDATSYSGLVARW